LRSNLPTGDDQRLRLGMVRQPFLEPAVGLRLGQVRRMSVTPAASQTRAPTGIGITPTAPAGGVPGRSGRRPP